jgi:hypothetical protein
MGAGNILGLLLEISADPSKGDAAVQAFAERTGQSIGMVTAQVKEYQQAETAAYDEALRRMRGGGEELDRSLIGNRESVRLLSEEFGLRLPRAVTGAVGQMLPEIASLGGGLLGVFAVEQAWKWAKAAVEAIRQAQGETQELKSMMDEIVQEQEKILRHPKTLEEATKDLDETTKRIGDINHQMDKLRHDLVETPKEAVEAVQGAAGAWGAPMMAEAAATSATAVNASQRLNELQAQLDNLTERQKAQLDEKTALQKKADEDAARDAKRAADEQTRIANQAGEAQDRAAAQAARRAMQEEEMIVRLTELADRSTKRMQKWHEEWLKEIGMPEEVKFSLQEINREINQQGLAAADALPKLTALGGGAQKLTEAQRQALPTEEQIKRVRQELARLYRVSGSKSTYLA